MPDVPSTPSPTPAATTGTTPPDCGGVAWIQTAGNITVAVAVFAQPFSAVRIGSIFPAIAELVAASAGQRKEGLP